MGVFTINSEEAERPNLYIAWSDTSTTEDRAGLENTISIEVNNVPDPGSGYSITCTWQTGVGSGFTDSIPLSDNPQDFNVIKGDNQYRIKIEGFPVGTVYSNVLTYTHG